MIARVARFARQPDRFGTGEYRWVLDAIRSCDGFVGAYHLTEDGGGDSISISFVESEGAARSAEEQVGRERERLGRKASPPDEVRIWHVVDAVER